MYAEDCSPCETCKSAEFCDGWEAQFCCKLCRWLNAEHCDDCDPMDI